MFFGNRFLNRLTAGFCLCAFAALSIPKSVLATDYDAAREERKLLPIESNDIENWPEGPEIGAQSAILMEMNTHTILYAKNIHEKSYPASTTKILTCLLAMQNCSMDEVITFSHDAIYDVPTDGSRLGGVDTGDTMLMENALYCVLVESANDVASAVGEHVAEKLGYEKNVESFAQIMNEKAASLGCTDTHFSNANGLYDDDHYTSAYDLALIGCEFFNNELLCKMSSTSSYHFRLKEDDTDDVWISSKNQLYKGKTYEYEYLLGSKTGFVSQSRQTLVSAAEKNGMKLVCVIFTEESPYQFEDTVTLFQYGFENFKAVSIDDNETGYKIDTSDLFDTESDLFGDSTPIISMESDKYIVLPNSASFADTTSSLEYNTQANDVLATINYTYNDINVGSCNILYTKSDAPSFNFDSESTISTQILGEMNSDNKEHETDIEETTVIFINVKTLIMIILFAAAVTMLILFIISVVKSYNFSPRGQSHKRRRERKKEMRDAKKETRQKAKRVRKQAKIDARLRKKKYK